MAAPDSHATIETVFRMESPRLIAGLVRVTRDVGLAEDAAQDSLVAALAQWPKDGVPDNPGAWLMETAKRRAVDSLRRAKRFERKQDEVRRRTQRRAEAAVPDLDAALDDDVGDDLLRLLFMACHPALPAESRAALTLRLVAGLRTDEIARAFLVPEATLAQRLVRAKKTLAKERAALDVPRGKEREARLASVLEVVYLLFNEGYAATAGEDWTRPALCEDALRLARILQGLAPKAAEVHGLAALLEIQGSRLAARVGPRGEPVLLLDQDRSRWDRILIRRGLDALTRAQALDDSGPYALQAAIAACHARALVPGDTDWARIAALYDTLARRVPSPVVELNRAVAHGMAFGPAAGLARVEPLADEPSLRAYALLPAVRGDLLEKLGRADEARAEFTRAASLTRNAREKRVLLDRASACSPGTPP